jgi:hypothetical protein
LDWFHPHPCKLPNNQQVKPSYLQQIMSIHNDHRCNRWAVLLRRRRCGSNGLPLEWLQFFPSCSKSSQPIAINTDIKITWAAQTAIDNYIKFYLDGFGSL